MRILPVVRPILQMTPSPLPVPPLRGLYLITPDEPDTERLLDRVQRCCPVLDLFRAPTTVNVSLQNQPATVDR